MFIFEIVIQIYIIFNIDINLKLCEIQYILFGIYISFIRFNIQYLLFHPSHPILYPGFGHEI